MTNSGADSPNIDESKGRNFIKFYGIKDSLSIGAAAAKSERLVSRTIDTAMKIPSEYRGYTIQRIENPKKIIFGRIDSPAGTIPAFSKDLLTLSRTYHITELPEVSQRGDAFPSDLKNLPAVSLRYGLYPEELVIGYIQTHSFLDSLEQYIKIKEDLGARPHEFLLAHFLARVAKTLDLNPGIGVFLATHYLHNPVYPTLRDRFFDEHYSLNPNRKRVIQILGEKNSWLNPEAIKFRKKRLDEIVKRRALISPPISIEFGGGLGFVNKKDWPEVFI